MIRLIIGNESLHENINDNGIIMIGFGTSRYLIANNPVFSCHSIHRCTKTYPDGKRNSQTEHVFMERKKVILMCT
jgi:hypothetical protein